MNAKTTQERQLKREIKWTEEALAISEHYHHPIAEAYKKQIPLEFRHITEAMSPDDREQVKRHLERLKSDLENLQEGDWE